MARGDEARIRVRLDTRQARSDLREMAKEGQTTAGRVGGRLRAGISRGLGLVGAGAAIGAGVQAVRGATAGGIGDIVGEALGPLGSLLRESTLGKMPAEARATKSAREETIGAFGHVTGITGKIPEAAPRFFEAVRDIRLDVERGRDKIATDSRFATEAGAEIQKAVKSAGTAIGNFAKELADGLRKAVGR